jgi:hypothetical protein
MFRIRSALVVRAGVDGWVGLMSRNRGGGVPRSTPITAKTLSLELGAYMARTQTELVVWEDAFVIPRLCEEE